MLIASACDILPELDVAQGHLRYDNRTRDQHVNVFTFRTSLPCFSDIVRKGHPLSRFFWCHFS